jgi:hypothetical protein
MNCVWPIAPAQLPVMRAGAHVARLKDAEGGDQLLLEEGAAAAVIGERRQRLDDGGVEPRKLP